MTPAVAFSGLEENRTIIMVYYSIPPSQEELLFVFTRYTGFPVAESPETALGVTSKTSHIQMSSVSTT